MIKILIMMMIIIIIIIIIIILVGATNKRSQPAKEINDVESTGQTMPRSTQT